MCSRWVETILQGLHKYSGLYEDHCPLGVNLMGLHVVDFGVFKNILHS